MALFVSFAPLLAPTNGVYPLLTEGKKCTLSSVTEECA
jgi:hypothetical protein